MSVSGLATQKEMGIGGPAIRTLVGDANNPEDVKVRDIWPFNDAPRGVRLRAVEKTPRCSCGGILPILGHADVQTFRRASVSRYP